MSGCAEDDDDDDVVDARSAAAEITTSHRFWNDADADEIRGF